MRLSTYSVGMPSDDVFVVQACHVDRGCSQVVTFTGSMGPAYSRLSDGTLMIDLLGGRIVKKSRDTIYVDGVETPVEIRLTKGSGDPAEMTAFRARLGLPPGDRFLVVCDRGLKEHPSFAPL